jgi:dihydrolipoamide dehydrogenase
VHYDVLVLGSGPAGFYCALHSARLGKKTILVERERLGGTGFRWGCLPVKMMLDRLRAAAGGTDEVRCSQAALIPATARRIQEVEPRIRRRLTAGGVEVAQGEGRLVDAGAVRLGRRKISASRIVIATGTEPEAWTGIPLDGETVLSHREILGLTEVPGRLLILGGDVEGIEFACLFARLGSRVTVIEKEGAILPGTDPDLAGPVEQDLLARGVSLLTGAKVRGCTLAGGASVSLSDGSTLEGDRVLVTGLRRPNFPQGLERIGIEHDDQKIKVNATLQTSCRSIYAAGDINGITGMAHAAIQQGLLAARLIAGTGGWEPDFERDTDGRPGSGARGEIAGAIGAPPYPRAMYTIPEIAGAGYQENELQAEGIPYRRLGYRLTDTWRGFSKGIEEGFIKVLSGEDNRILGLWICSADASEQAALFGPLLSGGLTLEGLKEGLILHPTLGEAALEAVLEGGQ